MDYSKSCRRCTGYRYYEETGTAYCECPTSFYNDGVRIRTMDQITCANDCKKFEERVINSK